VAIWAAQTGNSTFPSHAFYLDRIEALNEFNPVADIKIEQKRNPLTVACVATVEASKVTEVIRASILVGSSKPAAPLLVEVETVIQPKS